MILLSCLHVKPLKTVIITAISDIFLNDCINFPHVQWDQFMEIGKEVPDDVLQERIDELTPNKCCTLIYTVSPSFCTSSYMLK